MKEEPLVSIIIPVHNTVSYLHKCVESIRNQTLKQIEIILVDNLSVDGSSDLCDEYALIDSRIKVLHLPIAGLSIARNAGMQVATAPYIGFIDSDDYIDSVMFQEMLDALLQNDVNIAYCNFLLEYESKPSESPYQNSGGVFIRTSKEVLKDMFLEKVSCSACTRLYKRDFLASLKFPEGKNYEDRLVMYEWTAICENIVWVDKQFYHYVERQTSICHTKSPMNLYHYFLAEYTRVQFMVKHSIFEGKELYDIRSKIIGTCLLIFKEIMLMVKIQDFKDPVKDMRLKIKEIAALPSGAIESKYHRRARKITRFWIFYYLTHYRSSK